MAPRAGIGGGGFGVDAKLAVHFRKKLRRVPLIGMLLAGTESVYQFAGDVFGDAEDVVALIFSLQRGTPNAVNGLALLVHYVVVFEQVLAGIEVLGLDGFLGVFNTARNELGLNGHALGHTQAIHQGLDTLAAEDAHEVVFEREEKARGAGVALAAGAAAQLIVDAAGFIAFGAGDVQSAEVDRFVMLGLALIGKLFVDGLPLGGRNLKNFAFVLEEHHGHGGLCAVAVAAGAVRADDRGSGGIGHCELVFQEMLAG